MKFQLQHNVNCTGLTEYEPVLTPLVFTWLYGTVFRFYFRNIITVFVPFFLLAYLNVRIITTLRARQASFFQYRSSEHKASFIKFFFILFLKFINNYY